jgi:hypothetical protein
VSTPPDPRPSTVHRLVPFPDGDQWCVLMGEDLQVGIAGFGETPAKAMDAFDEAFWKGKTPAALRALADQETK